MPTRRTGQQYWTETQFDKLRQSPPGQLQSRGPLPWRLLAYMLDVSPEIAPIRTLVSKRLMPPKWLDASLRSLDQMLLILWTAGYVTLEPHPPLEAMAGDAASTSTSEGTGAPAAYQPQRAIPTPELQKLLMLRGVNPLYGVFVINQLGIADMAERLQAMECILELPPSVARFVRVPDHDELPPGPLATTRLDVQLLHLGLATPEELGAGEAETDEDAERHRRFYEEDRPRVLTLADKLRRLFDHDFPGVSDVRTYPVWVAGEVLQFGGDFDKYIVGKRLQRQEGVIFRHLLRLILLVAEFAQLAPPDVALPDWRAELLPLRDRLIETCRQVDVTSVDEVLQQAELTEVTA